MKFEVGAGMPTSFLSTVVLTEELDQKKKSGDQVIGGNAYAMGRVMGKFVAVPAWTEEEDWIPDMSDAELPA